MNQTQVPIGIVAANDPCPLNPLCVLNISHSGRCQVEFGKKVVPATLNNDTNTLVDVLFESEADLDAVCLLLKEAGLNPKAFLYDKPPFLMVEAEWLGGIYEFCQSQDPSIYVCHRGNAYPIVMLEESMGPASSDPWTGKPLFGPCDLKTALKASDDGAGNQIAVSSPEGTLIAVKLLGRRLRIKKVCNKTGHGGSQMETGKWLTDKEVNKYLSKDRGLWRPA
jgi:hypothetical protein